MNLIGKSDNPQSPDYVPSVNLGYVVTRTPSSHSIERFKRASRRSYEKSLKENTDPTSVPAKRHLDFPTNTKIAAEALLVLANSHMPPLVQPNCKDKENRTGN
jgi:hypothetical protein